MAEASRCRVARVCELLLAGRRLPTVQGLKLFRLKENLAANLNDIGDTRAGQPLRNSRNERNVLGDILADDTVTAGCRLNEYTLLVTHVERKAVNLYFTQPPHVCSHIASDSCEPRIEFLVGKNVVEAVHPFTMCDRVKQSRLGGATDLLSRAVLALNLGKSPFELG